MKKICPVCKNNEYSITRGIPYRGYPGLVIKCQKCLFEYFSHASAFFNMIVSFIIFFPILIGVPIILNLDGNFILIFILFVILSVIAFSVIGQYLFIPFLNFNLIHKKHCHVHRLVPQQKDTKDGD
jgi:uncharacterized protein (DUF983 family)